MAQFKDKAKEKGIPITMPFPNIKPLLAIHLDKIDELIYALQLAKSELEKS